MLGTKLPLQECAKYAVLAMACRRLDRVDEARGYLGRLREIIHEPQRALHPDALGLLRETEEVLRDP